MEQLLSTEELNSLIQKHRANYSTVIRCQHPTTYNLINSEFPMGNFGEKLYRYINKNTPNLNKCHSCQCETKFDSVFEGFRKHCSSKCSNSSPEVKNRKQQSYIKEYGVNNPSQSNIIKEKKKATFNLHYGVDCNLMCDETKEKIKKTNLEKYGVEYPNQNESIFHKVKNTNSHSWSKEAPYPFRVGEELRPI